MTDYNYEEALNELQRWAPVKRPKESPLGFRAGTQTANCARCEYFYAEYGRSTEGTCGLYRLTVPGETRCDFFTEAQP